MTEFDDNTLEAGRTAERVAIMTEFALVNQLIMDVTGELSDAVLELVTLEEMCFQVVNEMTDDGLTPSATSQPLILFSNLFDGRVPESAFDLWFEALAGRIRRCTTWIAKTSGMDTAVCDKLLVIENGYAKAMMYALTSPTFRGNATAARPMTSSVAVLEALAALDVLAAQLTEQCPESGDWVDNVVESTIQELLQLINQLRKQPRPDAT